MKLSESLSQELAGLVVNQIPWAIRRLRHLADLQAMERGAAWQATWSAATPARKSALITYLAGVLEAPTQNYFVLQHRPVPPEFSGWYEKVKDQLVALLGAPLLPLWEQYHTGAPSLDLAQLADTLATAYARVGDPFETSHFNEAAAALLTASGFPLPANLALITVLTNWVAAAKNRLEIDQNHYSDFQRVLALWLNNLRLKMQFTAEGAEWKTLKERGELLQDIYYQITELFNLQQRKDNELMREIQGAYDYDPIDAVRMVLPGELIDSIEQRLAGRAFSEQLLLDIKALSEHPAIKQDKKLRMANHWRMGACLHGLGQTPLAARHLRQAHHLAKEIGDLDDVLFALYQRASVMLPTEARSILSFCLEGITKTEEARNNVITPYQQSAFFNGRTELYRMAIAWACELGEWDTVLGVGELLKARNFLLHVDDADTIDLLRTNLARHYDALRDSLGAKRTELLRQRQLSYDNWLLENIRQAKQWEQVLPGKDLQRSLRQGEVALSYYEINAGAWLVGLISCEQLIVEMITVAPEVMAGWIR